MLKKEWGAERNWMLPHLFIPGKTSALIREFAVEEGLPLGRTAALAPVLAVKDLPLDRTLIMMMMMIESCRGTHFLPYITSVVLTCMAGLKQKEYYTQHFTLLLQLLVSGTCI